MRILWLMLAFLCLHHPPVYASGLDLVTEVESGELTCKTYRGLLAKLAVFLAPSSVYRHVRAVLFCHTADGGIVQALDRQGHILCLQTGYVDQSLIWNGTACGFP